MERCHPHNFVAHGPDPEGRFGIRVTLPPGDTFRNIAGNDWQAWHWFTDAASRDAAMADMARRHPYSRIGDEPRLVLEAVQR